jgi:serine protease inhibitor
MFVRRQSLLVAAAVLFAPACGSDGPTTGPLITALPRALTSGENKLIAADNRFAFTLLRQVARETGDTLTNLFVSPLSVAMALGMTYNGAAGTTETAMRHTLELEGMTVPEVNDASRSLIALLRGLDPGVRFQIANSIWYRQTFSVEQPFLDANRTYFDAEVAGLDFASPAAPQRINDWVTRQTQGLITDIVASPLPDYAMMYLINAIYFKGDWTNQFDRAHTAPAPFELADGSTVQVPMMHSDGPLRVRAYRDATVDVAELPYGGRAFAMTIVMPHDAAAFDSLVAGLTSEQWDGWVALLDTTRIRVSLPKFRLVNDLSLVSTLKALGMEVAFHCEPPDMADFTRMHQPQEACITDVKHKTYVDVNEEGTEAAAVTSVEIGIVSMPPEILIDRPYLFAIRERLSGTFLFLGAIRNPS